MIDAQGVVVRLGGETVLDGVSVSVDDGRFVGLVGPNGAGKTTLIRAINGRIAPEAGSVRVGGDPVSELSARERGRRIATVPQTAELSFDFTVREVVETGRHSHRPRLSLHDPDPGRVAWALDRAGVADLADRPVTAVSGGERQRVLLARALAQDAPLLLLDEPTANLDVHHRVRTLDLVSGLVAEDGRTVVAAIHDLDLAARFCDGLVLLVDGAVRASGTPGDVLTEANLRPAFGPRVVVSRDPATGSPSVVVRSERDGAAVDRPLSVD